MNTAAAYNLDRTTPLPPATRLRLVTCAGYAANDGIYDIKQISKTQNRNAIWTIQLHPDTSHPLPNPPPKGEGTNVARCAAQTLEDSNGNRTQQLENNGGTPETTSYGFDANDRLTTVNYPDKQTAYTFDNNANRKTEVTTAGGATTLNKAYSYNTRNQLTAVADNLNAANSAVYGFDANGNQTRKTQGGNTTNFAYDTKDQLTRVSRNNTNLGVFSYDYQGRRIVKDMGGSTVRYAYDGNSVLLETDTGGSTIAKFDYGPDRLLSMNHVTEGRAYYLFDALGSVSNLTNTAGGIQARYQYDAWGNYRSQAGASFNRFAFTGHEKDNETNLYYFKARFYDPETGRFLNQDAYLGDINTPPSLHRYLYAYSNPTVYIDLFGYESISAMIDNAADGCGAWSCAGYALLKGAYAASTFGFAVVHDPVRDQYDEGKITGEQYIKRGIGGGAAMVGVNVAGVALGGVGSGATATLASTMARGAVTGGTIAGGTDAVTQGVNIAAGLQDNYDVGRTVTATAVGVTLGAAVPAAAAGLATPTVKAITSKVSEAVSDTVANAGQAVKNVFTREGKGLATAESASPAMQGSVASEVSVGVNTGGVVADGAADVTRAGSSRPAWLARLDAGNDFNAARSSAYPHKEVYIDSPTGSGYTRLDSYNPTSGEIVSRKFTQLSNVQEQTAFNYINELPAKYPVNGTIANVPSSGGLAGQPLLGQQILEVPVQVNPIPQSVLDAANRAGVLIRDINGHVY